MGSRSNKISRFILRFRGNGATPLQMAEAAIREQGLSVVDQSSRMLLLEGAMGAAALSVLKNSLPGWSVSEKRSYSLPSPIPRVKARGAA